MPVMSQRQLYVYQVRTPNYCKPSDIVGNLTHSVWRTLQEMPELNAIDPHYWPGLYIVFRDALKTRLVRYKGCGESDRCAAGAKSVLGDRFEEEDDPESFYLLETHRDAEGVVRALSFLMLRRVRSLFSVSVQRRPVLKDRIRAAISQCLSELLFENTSCIACNVREGHRERRVWQ
ncbi:MAG: hypothetical protein HY548_07940 [Elusimicrobia bacterium]|nr:hypothetical protein [Elusimicrobiota bacterium]